MYKTRKDWRKNQTGAFLGCGKRMKEVTRTKRKTLKSLEVNNGNYLNKIAADCWDYC